MSATAPPMGSVEPKTTRPILWSEIAPAHIKQGSRVVYKARFSPACRLSAESRFRASISACRCGANSGTQMLFAPSAMISFPRQTTQPIGRFPARSASNASSTARPKKVRSTVVSLEVTRELPLARARNHPTLGRPANGPFDAAGGRPLLGLRLRTRRSARLRHRPFRTYVHSPISSGEPGVRCLMNGCQSLYGTSHLKPDQGRGREDHLDRGDAES